MKLQFDSKTHEDQVTKLYIDEYIKNGKSVYQIAKELKIKPQTLYRLFSKFGFKLRSNKINSRKYYFDDRYFHTIDTPEKAYWLGFIYADGYITTKRVRESQSLGIALSIEDRTHLEKLNNALNGNVEVKIYRESAGYAVGKEYCRIVFSSQHLVDDLKTHGVVEHKSNVLCFPSIDPSLTRDFIRGYFDGDGSVWMQKKHGVPKDLNIGFVGTDSMLISIQEELKNAGVIRRFYPLRKRRPYQVVSNFKFGGNIQAMKFLDYIYLDSSVFLDRKYKFYKQQKVTRCSDAA